MHEPLRTMKPNVIYRPVFKLFFMVMMQNSIWKHQLTLHLIYYDYLQRNKRQHKNWKNMIEFVHTQ